MNQPDPVHVKIREICLELPDTKETMTWGCPHFRVGEKIFAGYGAEKGKASISFKLEMDHADALVMNDPRFTRAPYVGQHGWVSMDATRIKDWNEIRSLVFESYRLIAPKRSLAKLGDGASKPAAATKKTTPKAPAKAPAGISSTTTLQAKKRTQAAIARS
jgi:predicted DNA-binding protein (MmcQ/YjbR family)